MRPLILLLLLVSLLPIYSADAATQSISTVNLPTQIDQFQTFSFTVNLVCASCSDSYIRAVFYPSGTSYFGYTQDTSGNWTNAPGGNCTSYYKVAKTDLDINGNWSGTLSAKIDTLNPYYIGPAEYLFKVGRYTASCGSPLWSSESTIAVTGPSPTPTPTVTPVPTPTLTPTSQPPTLKPTLVSPTLFSPSLTPTNTPYILPTLDTFIATPDVLATESVYLSPTPHVSAPLSLQKNTWNFSWQLIAGSIILCFTCGTMGYLYVSHSKKDDQ